jgi:hypothetical protein
MISCELHGKFQKESQILRKNKGDNFLDNNCFPLRETKEFRKKIRLSIKTAHVALYQS